MNILNKIDNYLNENYKLLNKKKLIDRINQIISEDDSDTKDELAFNLMNDIALLRADINKKNFVNARVYNERIKISKDIESWIGELTQFNRSIKDNKVKKFITNAFDKLLKI